MKKFLAKVMLFAVFCLLFELVIPIAVDPYNVFHAFAIRDNGVEPNKNYIKMKYVLANPDKFDSYIFGSSRVGSIHVEKMQGERCYNMTYSAGTPQEHLANIQTFVENGIVPKRIYIGVDSFSYTEDAKSHQIQPLRCPYEYEREHRSGFWGMYLNAGIAVQSLPTILHSEKTGHYAEEFYDYGWWCDYDRETTIDWDAAGPSVGAGDYLDETLREIREIVALCEQNHIELVVFTNPMHHLTYEESLKHNWMEFLRGLAEITDYYNFSGLNRVTTDNSYYIDTSHYNAYVGDMIIDCICNHEDLEGSVGAGFGVFVTKENVGELVKELE